MTLVLAIEASIAAWKNLMSDELFMEASYGMGVLNVREANGKVFVKTTGAEFDLNIDSGTVDLTQTIPARRQLAQLRLGGVRLGNLQVTGKGNGAVILKSGESR